MSHRYRLSPTHGQGPMLTRHCDDARFVWNLALEQFNLYRPTLGPTPRYVEQAHQLVEVRRETWLGQGSSRVQQTALRDFDRALRDWWAGVHGRPTWRKKGQHEGFGFCDAVKICVLNRKWATVHVPKCGPVKFRLSRPLPVDPGGVRVRRDRSGRWHVSFNAPQPVLAKTQTGAVAGLDMGIATTVATSDGVALRMPVLLSPGELRRKRRLQHTMARQRKGSNRRRRTRLALAAVSAREADRRKDWIEKITTDLVRGYDLIAIEDLRVANMVRSAKGTVAAPGKNVASKRGLNRAISNQAWGTFRRRLEDKAAAASSPTLVVAVNPVNTSRRCNACGHVASENRKSQAVFGCVKCGHTANADVNAAKNILAAGLAVTGRGGTPHAKAQRPDEASTKHVDLVVGVAELARGKPTSFASSRCPV